MSGFDVIKDSEGKEYLVFDSTELYDDSQMGSKSDDFELLKKLGQGAFGKVFKVRSKINNKVYAMKKLNIKDIREQKGERAYELTINENSILQGLNHPHIIKYYKNFTEGDYMYIIIELAANGDMDKYIEVKNKIGNHLQEEQLWNIFLQCMEALAYVHSTGVIHRDIKPENLLLDNNMSIKLGDFGVSAIQSNKGDNQYLNAEYIPFKNKENMKYHGTVVGTSPYMANEIQKNEYDQKVDVYAMGISFFEMAYFFNPKITPNRAINVQYSNELNAVINMMREEDKNKRKTSQEIFEIIQKIYSSKYVKNTSIDAIMRCLSCYEDFNGQIEKIENNPIANAYLEIMESKNNPNLLVWVNSINNFRQIVASLNPKLEGTKEIDPRIVFAFLLGHLHKELNKPQAKTDKSNNYLINSGKEEAKTSKIEMMLKFINEVLIKFNSCVSRNFMGYMKLTNFCSICELKTFSFTSYFFVTFNLEKLLKKKNYKVFSIEENFGEQNKNNTEKLLYCSKCLNKTKHFCYKQFYLLPQILIISIQRGITYNFKIPIKVPEILDLNDYAEFEYCKKKFNLMGLIGRSYTNGNETFFSVVRFNQSWFCCEGININQINSPEEANSKGDILLLFYDAIK